MKTINISTRQSAHSYDVRIERGYFSSIATATVREWRGSSIFIITDSNVKRRYGWDLLRALLKKEIDAWIIDFPAGEDSKNADLVNMVYTQLLEHGVRRNSLIIALGGGVVGDIAGYVAATVLRGIKYIQVPTTLLAQVDSSVGGKVGIDHPLGKNLIGAFHQPAAVYIDPLVLRTLPDREYKCGLAEVVKIAASLDASFFKLLEKKAPQITKRNQSDLSEIICRSIQLKAAVVEKDEHESGLRKALNLGHTIGHAVESASDYKLRHGEAVAIGLAAESRIARDMGLLSPSDLERLLRLMKTLKLPTSFPRLKHREAFLSALAADKKSAGSSPKFVLLQRIGCSVVGIDVAAPFIERLIQ